MEDFLEAASDGNGKRTLLIVDDDTECTELLKAFFREKYHVRVANLASEAIEIVRNDAPSVIIVDLVMPSMDGFGIIHRLNESYESRIPTILLTGWKTQEVEECAVTMGCAAVVSKPVTLPALDELVSSLMSRAAACSVAAL